MPSLIHLGSADFLSRRVWDAFTVASLTLTTRALPSSRVTRRRPYSADMAERGFRSRELQPQEAPTELILRPMEIKFIMRSPELWRVAEMWREICGVTLGRAAGN